MSIIHKKENKTSIQPILKSNSTSFMVNNIFCEVKGKKVIHWGGYILGYITPNYPLGGGRAWGNRPNYILEVQFQYLLGYPSNNTLLCLLLDLYVLFSSIHSFFYLTTALLKSDAFRHSKAYSCQSFQLTGIGLGSS